MSNLALHGGKPVRATMLPYATQAIDADDKKAVAEVLSGTLLTTGPAVRIFEDALCAYTGAKHAIAVNNGTSALHIAACLADIGPGDEVIVPAISFVASANCVLYQRGTPVFADLKADDLTIDPEDVARKITPKTKAIVIVDYAGHPCAHDALSAIAAQHGLAIIDDAAHALGAEYHGRKVGVLQDFTTMSFHPVKHITTGEGGAILTDSPEKAQMARSLRHHGIDLDWIARGQQQGWTYDVPHLGYNYRIPDINCALGISQLKKLDGWNARRREIATHYAEVLKDFSWMQLPVELPGCRSAWHLYPVRLNLEMLQTGRTEVFAALRAENIGVNVHYIPIPWLTLYQNLGYRKGQCPVAEREYERLLSLPMYPGMADQDVADVAEALAKIWAAYKR